MEAPASEDDLWLALGDDVNPNRPIFTGDVFDQVRLGDADEAAMVVAHPCSIRGRAGRLGPRILMAPVRPYQPLRLDLWATGHYGVFPLPALSGGSTAAALDELTPANTADVLSAVRVGCLSVSGVNLLQQRLVMRLTRVDIPTQTFHQAFSYTYEEADLLEEWSDTFVAAGVPLESAVERFELEIRTTRPDGTSMQSDLRDVQRRAAVRRQLREAAENAISDSQ